MGIEKGIVFKVRSIEKVENNKLKEGTWIYTLLKLKDEWNEEKEKLKIGDIVLAEMYAGGGWCLADCDIVDRNLFNKIQKFGMESEKDDDSTFEQDQEMVLKDIAKIKKIKIEK